MNGHTVTVLNSPADIAAHAAELVSNAAEKAIAERGRYLLVLAGGNTPTLLYHVLAEQYAKRIDWARVQIFFGDERCVPHDDPQSNAGMARNALLNLVPIPESQVHFVNTSLPPSASALEYEGVIREAFGHGSSAMFDTVLLGMGSDGHTLSLFPGSPALEEKTRFCIATQAPEAFAVRDRITLTQPPVQSAIQRIVLVTGADKRDTLRRVLDGDPALPLSRFKTCVFLVDSAAST